MRRMPYCLLPKFQYHVAPSVPISSLCIVCSEYLVVGLRNGYIGVHMMACEDTERETAVHSLTTRAYKYSEVNTPINCNVLYIILYRSLQN